MKNILGLILGLLPLLANAQWTDVSLSDTTVHLDIVSFSSANDGIVSALYWNTYYKTDDGGNSWTEHTFDSLTNLKNIQFTDALTGYAMGNRIGTFAPSFLKTTDGGATWQTISSMNSVSLNYFSFVDNTTGFAIGDDWVNFSSIVYRTIDGGATWDTTHLPGVTYPVDVSIVSEDTIIFGGSDGTFSYRGTMLSTYDGGDNWVFRLDTNNYSQIQRIDFLTGTHGFKLNSGSGDYVSETWDGGITWNTIFQIGPFENLTDVFFSTADDGYISHYFGHVIGINAVGDTTLSFNEVNYQYQLQKMDDADHVLYAVGSYGKVIKKGLSTGIDAEFESSHLTSYPNPVGTELTIETPAQGTLELYSTDGRLLQSKTVQVGIHTMDMSPFATGTYIVSFRNKTMQSHSIIIHQ